MVAYLSLNRVQTLVKLCHYQYTIAAPVGLFNSTGGKIALRADVLKYQPVCKPRA